MRADATHGHHQVVNTKIRLIILFAAEDGEALYSQQKQDRELNGAQIMNSLLSNSVPWTAKRSSQSILKEISPGCSLEGLMLKLQLQYFGHLMRRADSFEKTVMLGKIEGPGGEGDDRG